MRYISESDIDLRPVEYGQPVSEDELMTYEEWWDEFRANACCPDSGVAYRLMCPCGGSAQVPSGISRLLELPDDFVGPDDYYDDDDGYGKYGRDCD